jgi:hypothetical protein
MYGRFEVPDVYSAALQAGDIGTFGITLQKQVTPAAFTPLEFHDI